ncbi:MAG: thiamine-phosphate kinase [Candidatus Omnitrophica bacterium]|nr:thiamine-phosphate kinase [Candidatus Omnitrophota bacterium]MBU1997008.1 thiamine-phosphate kinase [Candidatus Omnitrophota bacterium]MBU4333675.1 thiamine-phosphate kinase [Candidatus Omnitrophota bacterium]
MKKKIASIGEFGLIDILRSKTSCSSDVIKGIGDDTAVVKMSSKKRLLLTTDMLVEGVHFTKDSSPKAIGYKAVCCSVSDIAAMGGIPKHAVISFGVAPSIKLDFILKIHQGMKTAAKRFGVNIVGGDTVRSENNVINVALTGEVNADKAVYRDGAKVGDKVFVTGRLGNSLNSGWHLRFMPRVAESQYLVNKYKISSMIDISDGLVPDLDHILKGSKVGAILYEKNVPLRKDANIEKAYYDGEDFELLFTVSPKEAKKILSQKKYIFYHIGEIVRESIGLLSVDVEGEEREIKMKKGFVHF